jgi:2-oxoglutarate ferredoxin oxidoreductase subunit alpha
MQGDLLQSYRLSHGDAKHPVLLPSTPEECFEFGQTAFDLAERLQTLVLVLSDLDLGMNFHMAKKFQPSSKSFDRGKVMTAADLDKAKSFARYRDVDGDGIPYRTLPGTEHPLAAYFTRGTGHDEDSKYSEDSEVFAKNMVRLNKKWETAKTLVPAPIIDENPKAKIALIAYGSTHDAIAEIRNQLGVETSYLRVKALPMTDDIAKFARKHDRVFVLEQNRDGQLTSILRAEFPIIAAKLEPICVFDGLPVSADVMTNLIRGSL